MPMTWGHAAVLSAALIWGTNHVATRALAEDVPLFALTFWRWAIALLFLVPIAWRWLVRDSALLHAARWPLALAGLNGMGVFGIAISGAPYYTTAANVSLISSTSPLWVLVFAGLTRTERITARQVIGIVVAFLGTAHIVLGGQWHRLATVTFAAGDLIAVGAAMLWAIFSVQVKRLPAGLHPLSITVAAAFAGFLFLALVYLAWGLSGQAWLRQAGGQMDHRTALALLGYIALGPSLLGNLTFTAGVQRVGPAVAGALLTMTPVFATIFAVTLLDEHLAPHHGVGVAGIAIGLWLATVARR
jgi:drug/metabolite transporter (DMT)-like permease